MYDVCTRVTKVVAHHNKIGAVKVVLPIFLLPKLRSVLQNEWKKQPYIFFSIFGSKINEFEPKK